TGVQFRNVKTGGGTGDPFSMLALSQFTKEAPTVARPTVAEMNDSYRPMGTGIAENLEPPVPAKIAAFTELMTPMAAKRASNVLISTRVFNGEVMPIHEGIERRVAEGWKVESSPQKGRRFTGPDGRFLDEGAITKTGMDYA